MEEEEERDNLYPPKHPGNSKNCFVSVQCTCCENNAIGFCKNLKSVHYKTNGDIKSDNFSFYEDDEKVCKQHFLSEDFLQTKKGFGIRVKSFGSSGRHLPNRSGDREFVLNVSKDTFVDDVRMKMSALELFSGSSDSFSDFRTCSSSSSASLTTCTGVSSSMNDDAGVEEKLQADENSSVPSSYFDAVHCSVLEEEHNSDLEIKSFAVEPEKCSQGYKSGKMFTEKCGYFDEVKYFICLL